MFIPEYAAINFNDKKKSTAVRVYLRELEDGQAADCQQSIRSHQ